MTAAPRTVRSEAGTTLIELLVAVSIMGIAFVTIVGGIGVAIIGAATQRRDATSGAVLATAAEKVLAESTMPYVSCALTTPPAYTIPLSPSGFTVAITKITFWDPSTNQFADTLTSCNPGPAVAAKDNGLQLIDLTVTSTSGTQGRGVQVLQVAKRQLDT